MPAREEGELLWEPSARVIERSNLRKYLRFLETEEGLRFEDYGALWSWSVTDLERFWSSIWKFYGVRASKPYSRVLASRAMPGARWFEGSELNYAEHALARTGGEQAVVWRREDGARGTLSADELRDQVARARAGL